MRTRRFVTLVHFYVCNWLAVSSPPSDVDGRLLRYILVYTIAPSGSYDYKNAPARDTRLVYIRGTSETNDDGALLIVGHLLSLSSDGFFVSDRLSVYIRSRPIPFFM